MRAARLAARATRGAPRLTLRFASTVSEAEVAQTFATIHARLLKRGHSDADRIRRHLRRCDDAKGYSSKKVSVADAVGVLQTLGLKDVRKPLVVAVVERFSDKPGAHVADHSKEAVIYDSLCDCLTEGQLPPMAH